MNVYSTLHSVGIRLVRIHINEILEFALVSRCERRPLTVPPGVRTWLDWDQIVRCAISCQEQLLMVNGMAAVEPESLCSVRDTFRVLVSPKPLYNKLFTMLTPLPL